MRMRLDWQDCGCLWALHKMKACRSKCNMQTISKSLFVRILKIQRYILKSQIHTSDLVWRVLPTQLKDRISIWKKITSGPPLAGYFLRLNSIYVAINCHSHNPMSKFVLITQTGVAEQETDNRTINCICKTMNIMRQICPSFKRLCIIMLPLNNSP